MFQPFETSISYFLINLLFSYDSACHQTMCFPHYKRTPIFSQFLSYKKTADFRT
ncbi:hypothetical protein [Brotaphodocola sp.]|uniref:hypothetical protein n=1 Tax=Brotaphodocola sp. TaxID=3073577 RepID=UPI003D7D2615